MLRKRLVGVITVKSGWAVQSFGYSRHLPIGKPEILAENLDRWGADEILLLDIDRSRNGLGPNFDLIRQIGRRGISSPISYGGGIRNEHDAAEVIKCGAERLCVDTLLHSKPEQVVKISECVGAQAVIASLPLTRKQGVLLWHNYQTKENSSLETLRELVKKRILSEMLLIDFEHEGTRGAFEETLLNEFPFPEVPHILFGGISEAPQIARLLSHPSVIAVAVGNFLNYQEHAIQTLKQTVALECLRPAKYLELTNEAKH
jgi:cyclase